MADIYQAIKQLTTDKQYYFKYKFPELKFDQSRPLWTQKQFLNYAQRKTMNPFIKWEKTSEYKNLIQLYLDSKIADDFREIYQVVSENAKKGDDKAIRQFLILQKEIQSNAKVVGKLFDNDKDESDDTHEFDLNWGVVDD